MVALALVMPALVANCYTAPRIRQPGGCRRLPNSRYREETSMSEIQIYHNPRCSKSRQTLALLQQQGIEPSVIEYLKDVPSAADIESLLSKLGITARELLRTKEDAYKEHNLSDASLSDADIIRAMVASPKLIERPIVVNGNQARIGRPPEQVLEII